MTEVMEPTAAAKQQHEKSTTCAANLGRTPLVTRTQKRKASAVESDEAANYDGSLTSPEQDLLNTEDDGRTSTPEASRRESDMPSSSSIKNLDSRRPSVANTYKSIATSTTASHVQDGDDIDDDDADDDDSDYEDDVVVAAAVVPERRSKRARVAKRRAEAINTEAANSAAKLEPLGGAVVGEGRSICVCTPAPKVPRPRNAFILYRQHHQAGVAAKNPGLPNPEISKIIGEHWRDESEEEKAIWRRLADEEKENHSRAHPNYRYQPRRGTRGPSGGAVQLTTPGEGPGNCGKCGGRFIATPRTPSTAGFVPVDGRRESQESQISASMGHPQQNPIIHHQQTHQQGHAHQQSHTHPHDRQQNHQHGHLPFRDYEAEHADSPLEIKKRRFNYPPPAYHHSSPTQYANTHTNGHGYHGRENETVPPPPTPIGSAAYDRGPLPSPAAVLGRPKGAMGPPPRHALPGYPHAPHPMPPYQYSPYYPNHHPPPPLPNRGPHPPYHRPHHTHNQQASGFDESLRLPPLQVPRSPKLSPVRPGEPIVRANVSKTVSSPIGVAAIRRGDTSLKSVEAMVMSIPFHNKMNVLRKISPPLPLASSLPATPTTSPTGASASTPGGHHHQHRGVIIAVEGAHEGLRGAVAGAIARALGDSGEVALRTWDSGMDGVEEAGEGSDMFAAYLSLIVDWHGRAREIVQHTRGEANTPNAKFPVALLGQGFSLTLSDKFACTTPIGDEYSPVDHWQWMATLWRGIVGPDLVVHVSEVGSGEAGRPEDGGVDASRAVADGIVMVKVSDGGLEEKVERRVAFEMMEWVRGRR